MLAATFPPTEITLVFFIAADHIAFKCDNIRFILAAYYPSKLFSKYLKFKKLYF